MISAARNGARQIARRREERGSQQVTATLSGLVAKKVRRLLVIGDVPHQRRFARPSFARDEEQAAMLG